jgi:hypothetical protein
MDGLEEVLGLYATSQPIAVLQQSDNRGQQGRGFATRGRSGQGWSSGGDQQVRIILLTPWYKVFLDHNKNHHIPSHRQMTQCHSRVHGTYSLPAVIKSLQHICPSKVHIDNF